jgi:hypothetical protein
VIWPVRPEVSPAAAELRAELAALRARVERVERVSATNYLQTYGAPGAAVVPCSTCNASRWTTPDRRQGYVIGSDGDGCPARRLCAGRSTKRPALVVAL